MRTTLPLAFACLLSVTACGSSWPVEPEAPHVKPAPKEIARLAIHVHASVNPPETPEDEWEYHHLSGWTTELRGLFQGALQEAGYTVIVDRHMPADLVANVQADWPSEQPGVATLVLTDRGEVIERLSVGVRMMGTPPETIYLRKEAAVALVDAMNRSPKVLAYARDFEMRHTAKVASPAPAASQ